MTATPSRPRPKPRITKPAEPKPAEQSPVDAKPVAAAPRRSRVAKAAPTATKPVKAAPAAATPEVEAPAVEVKAPKRSTVRRTSTQRHLRAVGGTGDKQAPPPPPPSAPEGLGERGKSLWRDVVEVFELRADELVVLRSACFAEQRVHGIREELSQMDILVRGSMGQLVANPLLTEVRAHEGHVAMLLAKLKLKDVGAGAAQGRSDGARAAAQARWSTPHGASS